MRRTAVALPVCSLLLILASGCGLAGKKNAKMSSVSESAFAQYSPLEMEPESDSYPMYGSAVPVESADEAISAFNTPTSMETRYHVVAKRDTLYALARQYYGDQRRWKDIYEANRSALVDPNKISVGQSLLIP